MSRKIRSAIVGCGVIAPNHAQALKQIENAELVACCDIIPERAQAIASQYGCDAYTDYAEMLRREDIDLVHICVFSGLHAQLGIQAAKAGKHLLVEKPIDVTLEAANALIDACKQQGVLLSVISQNRWQTPMVALKQAIDAGELGELHFAASHTKWWRSQEYYDGDAWRGTWELDGGGALMNQSVHYVDLMQYMMGPVAEVNARTALRAHKDIEVEDIAAAVVQFESGALGLLEGNTAAYPGFTTRLDVYGQHGGVIVEDNQIQSWKTTLRTLDGKDALAGSAGGASSAQIAASQHTQQIQDVVDAILTSREPAVTGESARHALAIILAVYESARQGGVPVRVKG